MRQAAVERWRAGAYKHSDGTSCWYWERAGSGQRQTQDLDEQVICLVCDAENATLPASVTADACWDSILHQDCNSHQDALEQGLGAFQGLKESSR